MKAVFSVASGGMDALFLESSFHGTLRAAPPTHQAHMFWPVRLVLDIVGEVPGFAEMRGLRNYNPDH